jgi:hypothetical protein
LCVPMKLKLAAVLCVAVAVQAAVSPPYRQWSVPLWNEQSTQAAAAGPDGSVFALYVTGNNSERIGFVKISPQGTLLWDRCVGNLWPGDFDIALAATSDGGLIAAAGVGASESQEGTCSLFRTNAAMGLDDGWVIRLNADGTKRWDRTFGGTGYEEPMALVEAAGGGFYLLANSDSPVSGNRSAASFGGYDVWLVRLDGDGNKLWDRSYGGAGNDSAQALVLLPDGGCVVAGDSSSSASGNKTNAATGAWFFRVDGNGNKLWEYVHTSTYFAPQAIRLLANGELLVSFANSSLRLSTSGQFLGENVISPQGTVFTTLSANITPDGGIIGYTNGVVSVVRFNGTNVVWSFTPPAFTRIRGVTGAGGLIGTESQGSYYNLFLTKPDAFTARPQASVEFHPGAATVTFSGVSNHSYALEQTTNFSNWVPLRTNLFTSNSWSSSIVTSNRGTFFRARLVP